MTTEPSQEVSTPAMYSYLNPEIPLVFVCNSAEAVFAYMNRAESEADRHFLIREMQALGDRALLYPVERKLVFTSLPLHHESLLNSLGYSQTHYYYPHKPSPRLSLDLLQEPVLLEKIATFAGEGQSIQLIPQVTTLEFLALATALRRDYGLEVLLPESPDPSCLWVRDYIDSKTGFRHLATAWLPDAVALLPQGFICSDLSQAASIAYWFSQCHQSCIVKADCGNDALGHTVISPAPTMSVNEIYCCLQQNEFLQASMFNSLDQESTHYSDSGALPLRLASNLLIVEEYLPSPEALFPSAEFFVPPLGTGTPYLTYVCNQLFYESGTFAGIIISSNFQTMGWYTALVSSGLHMAKQLQQMGYVGHFDLDAIASQEEILALLEINARRTGGTHVHELAWFLLGQSYLQFVTLISNTAMSSGKIQTFDNLVEAIASILYPMQQNQQGVIITHTSNLEEHKFGYIIIAPSMQRGLELRQELVTLLTAA